MVERSATTVGLPSSSPTRIDYVPSVEPAQTRAAIPVIFFAFSALVSHAAASHRGEFDFEELKRSPISEEFDSRSSGVRFRRSSRSSRSSGVR